MPGSSPRRPDPDRISNRAELVEAIRQLKGRRTLGKIGRQADDRQFGDNRLPPNFEPEELNDSTLSGWMNPSSSSLPSARKFRTYLAVSDVPPDAWARWLNAIDRLRSQSAARHADSHQPGAGGDRVGDVAKVRDADLINTSNRPETVANSPGRGRRPAAARVGFAVAGVIVVLVVAVLVLNGTFKGERTPATPPLVGTTSSPAPSADPQVLAPGVATATFKPITMRIVPGGNVLLQGQVAGLFGRSMWIVEQVADSPEKLIISSTGAVTSTDGEWRLTANQVGEASDRQSSVKFLAVAANNACDQGLSARIAAAGAGEVSVPRLPDGCVELGHTYGDFTD